MLRLWPSPRRLKRRIVAEPRHLFKPVSGISLFEGMGVEPLDLDPLIAAIPRDYSRKVLNSVAENIRTAVRQAQSHTAYLI